MDDLSQFLLKVMTMDLTTVLNSVNLLYLIALHIHPLKNDKDAEALLDSKFIYLDSRYESRIHQDLQVV